MGRSLCCDKVGLKKGPWTPEEDQKLLAYIEEHGHGSWRALPAKAGLQRCGKSCRLRWTNYLRPDIKRGKFSLQEEQTIIQLHALLGNRWSAIATHLPKRTDNEIKNYWNTHLKKRLDKMGIDPVTHKPKNDALFSSEGQSKNTANLSHMAQWESARLEAEARLVRESKLRSQLSNTPPPNSHPHQSYKNNNVPISASTSTQPPRSLDVLNSWSTSSPIGWSSILSDHHNTIGSGLNIGIGSDIDQSPTSTLTFSENAPRQPPLPQMVNSATSGGASGGGEDPIPMIEFVGTSGNSSETTILKNGHHQIHDLHENSISFTSNLQDQMTISVDRGWTPEFLRSNASIRLGHNIGHVMEEGFTSLLLSDSNQTVFCDSAKEINSDNISDGNGSGGREDCYDDNKNYWSSILNLVNSSPSESAMF